MDYYYQWNAEKIASSNKAEASALNRSSCISSGAIYWTYMTQQRALLQPADSSSADPRLRILGAFCGRRDRALFENYHPEPQSHAPLPREKR
jgi:hypothetical protein